jgi:multiple sugar transport system ATP-binding protein
VVAAFRERVSAKPGEAFALTPDPALVHLFDEATGKRIN